MTTPHQPFALPDRTSKRFGSRRGNPAPYLSERASNDDLSAIRRPMCETYVVLGKATDAHPHGTPLLTCSADDGWELLHTVPGARAAADAARHDRVFAYLGPRYRVGAKWRKGPSASGDVLGMSETEMVGEEGGEDA